MNIDQIISNILNGDPIHDGITLAIVFTIILCFYNEIFRAVFSIFK